MRAEGDDTAHLEAARLRLVGEKDRTPLQLPLLPLLLPLLSVPLLLPAALFRRGSVTADTMSSRRFLPPGSFASSWL